MALKEKLIDFFVYTYEVDAVKVVRRHGDLVDIKFDPSSQAKKDFYNIMILFDEASAKGNLEIDSSIGKTIALQGLSGRASLETLREIKANAPKKVLF